MEGIATDLGRRFWQNRPERLERLRNEFFGADEELQSETVNQLNDIAERAVGTMVDDMLEEPRGMSTGVVLAGFGENDLFPGYLEVAVDGLIGNVLKKSLVRQGKCGTENEAAIIPFAQDDMIHEFMRGIAPTYFPYLYQSMISHLTEFTKHMLGTLHRYSEEEKEQLSEALGKAYPEIARLFVDQVRDVGR